MNMVTGMKYSGPTQALVKATVKIAQVNKRTLEGWKVSKAHRRRFCERFRCVNLPNEFAALSDPISPKNIDFSHTFIEVCLRFFGNSRILPIEAPSCRLQTRFEMATQIRGTPGSKL